MIPEYITVSCPHCGAVAGENCQDYAGRPRLRIHLSRITNLWTTIQRNGEPMPIIDNKIAVGKGARWLDVVRPGWYKKSRFDLDRHDVAEYNQCPLAQAFGDDYDIIIEHIMPVILGITDEAKIRSWEEEHGFSIPSSSSGRESKWDELTKAWKKEVKKRRKENKKKKVPCDAT